MVDNLTDGADATSWASVQPPSRNVRTAIRDLLCGILWEQPTQADRALTP